MADEQKFADEIMSDEELDKVAGGNYAETSLDSHFLHALNGSCGIYMPNDCLDGKHDAEIAAAWKSVGVIACLRSGITYLSYDTEYGCGTESKIDIGKDNVYWIHESSGAYRPVNRAEAMLYARDYVKSHS